MDAAGKKECRWQRHVDKATMRQLLMARGAQEKKPLFTDNGTELEQNTMFLDLGRLVLTKQTRPSARATPVDFTHLYYYQSCRGRLIASVL